MLADVSFIPFESYKIYKKNDVQKLNTKLKNDETIFSNIVVKKE